MTMNYGKTIHVLMFMKILNMSLKVNTLMKVKMLILEQRMKIKLISKKV